MATLDELDGKVDTLLDASARQDERLRSIRAKLDEHVGYHSEKTNDLDRRIRRVEVAVLGAVVALPPAVAAAYRILGA